MILFPSAKINFGLNVLNKRKDGFHNLETCMFPIPLYDVLEILPSSRFCFTQSGLDTDCLTKDNLCVRAYHLINDNYAIDPVYLHLQKNIPMGAGLGGGSSDAAYTLKALNQLFDLKIKNTELSEMASFLGSDCAFFIDSSPKLCTSKGEIMSKVKIDLFGCYLKLIYPNIHVSTKQAYSNVKCHISKNNIKQDVENPIIMWKNTITNSFEQSVFQLHPILSSIKQSLYDEGAIYASMTGSGSTLFGIYDKEPHKSFVLKKYYFEFICAI